MRAHILAMLRPSLARSLIMWLNGRNPSGSPQCQYGRPRTPDTHVQHPRHTAQPFDDTNRAALLKGHNHRAAQERPSASGHRQRPLNGRTSRWQHCMAVVATVKAAAHHCRRRSSSGRARRRAPWRTCHATPCAGTCSPACDLRKCWLQACQGGSRASCRCCIRQMASGRTCHRT